MKVYRLESIETGFGPFTTFDDNEDCLAPVEWIHSHYPPHGCSPKVRQMFANWKSTYNYIEDGKYLPDEFRFAFTSKYLLRRCFKGYNNKKYRDLFVLKIYDIDTSDNSLFLKLPNGQIIFSIDAIKVDSLTWFTPTMKRKHGFIFDLSWELINEHYL